MRYLLRLHLAVEAFGTTPLQYRLGNLAKNPASDDEKKKLGMHELRRAGNYQEGYLIQLIPLLQDGTGTH